MYSPKNLPHPFYTDKYLEARHAAHQALLFIARNVPEEQTEEASRRAAKFIEVFDELLELARRSESVPS